MSKIPKIENFNLHKYEEMLRENDWDEVNAQTRYRLQSKTNLMQKRMQNSVSLENWRKNKNPSRYISIPNTNLKAPRLTNDSRKVIKGIIKLAFEDGFMLNTIKYEDLFVTDEFDVWAIDPYRRKWASLKQKEKVDHIKSIGCIIDTFVSRGGDEVPPDVKLLINYLKQTSVDKFNLKVVLYHPSLLCHKRLSYQAEYLYHHVMHELEAAMPRVPPYNQSLQGSFYNLVRNNFKPISCGNVKDMTNFFMLRACNNKRMYYLHGMISRLSDENVAKSVFGYLLVMKHGLKHLLDNENKVGLENPNISREEADNWLYIMNPEYLSKLVHTFIENNMLPDCWMLPHGSI
ncbi:hypothetical protein LIER_35255 [Lithospermum erythrorhizon]|uniref:Uncharacterized protein n=1 Tax=Lithospermum erythrorhizon TaxID=34254 RepID=A0AAV3NNY5_LITER